MLEGMEVMVPIVVEDTSLIEGTDRWSIAKKVLKRIGEGLILSIPLAVLLTILFLLS